MLRRAFVYRYTFTRQRRLFSHNLRAWNEQDKHTDKDRTYSNIPKNETLNITNVLNELNDEGDFDPSRRITYKTTASELVEKMNRNAEQRSGDTEAQPLDEEQEQQQHQLKTMSADVEVEPVEEKKELINVANYINTHQIYARLREAELSDEQAKLVMNVIVSQIQTNITRLLKKHSPMLDLHNENYLFQAAQQELKSEMSASRDSDLNLLINSSILLKRSFQALEDELVINYKLMDNSIRLELNQFKHENNLHNKQLDLKNQDLNNKIITDLVGELRSYVESLRWALTRSALMTIFVMVFLAITSYTVIKNSEDEEEARQLQDAVNRKNDEIDSKQIIDKMTHDKEDKEEEAEASLDEN